LLQVSYFFFHFCDVHVVFCRLRAEVLSLITASWWW